MEQSTAAKPIVVGHDGSPGADLALRWALAEGRLSGLPVHVLQIFEWPVNVPPAELGWLNERQRDAARAALKQAVAEAGGGAVEVSIVDGSTIGTLCRLSKEAAMVVLGAQGGSGFAALLIGSAGLSVALHAACPVVIVRGPSDSGTGRLPVIVGVDDSAQAQLAAQFAFAEASRRGCAVSVVRAWRPVGDPSGEMETAERYAIRQLVSPIAKAHPEVEWSIHLIAGGAAKSLIESSAQAQLVAVGHRGMGGFKGLLLGSVAQQLLYHAQCPVAIVR